MPLNRGITFNASLGQSGGGRFVDVQVVAGIAEYNPRRRFAGAARDRDRGRLPRRQHRLEPLDRRPAGPALLGRYHHMKAVGLVYVIDQGRVVGPSFVQWPVTGAISAAWAVTAPATTKAPAARRVLISFFIGLCLFQRIRVYTRILRKR
jgi:hypothetical protein